MSIPPAATAGNNALDDVVRLAETVDSRDFLARIRQLIQLQPGNNGKPYRHGSLNLGEFTVHYKETSESHTGKVSYWSGTYEEEIVRSEAVILQGNQRLHRYRSSQPLAIPLSEPFIDTFQKAYSRHLQQQYMSMPLPFDLAKQKFAPKKAKRLARAA